MKKTLLIACAVILSAFAFAWSQQVEDVTIQPNNQECAYFYVTGSNGGTTWSLDSGGTGTATFTDTSNAYRIVPGLFYTAKAKCVDAADTVSSLQIWYNSAPTMTGAKILDSFTAAIGGSAGVGGWRDFWGGSAGLKYPVTEGRYVMFVARNDTGSGANANTFTLEVFSSVKPTK